MRTEAGIGRPVYSEKPVEIWTQAAMRRTAKTLSVDCEEEWGRKKRTDSEDEVNEVSPGSRDAVRVDFDVRPPAEDAFDIMREVSEVPRERGWEVDLGECRR